jgi:glucans biosynthesis protein C
VNTPSQPTIPVAESRLHYMDNLRALAMLAGVVFHASLAHSVLMHEFWPTADAGRSIAVDAFAWFSHLFRMPLFFVVAGFFVALLVQKRGMVGMLRNRFARVLLPFILFWPLVYFSMGWLIIHAAANVESLSPLLKMIKPWLANPNQPATLPSLVHLWFLPYLMCFCVLAWVADALEIRWPQRWFADVPPGVFACVAPLLLVPAFLSVPAPLPAPESFFPQWWALLLYGVYFAIGYRFLRDSIVIERLKHAAPFLLISALIGYAAFFQLLQTAGASHASLARGLCRFLADHVLPDLRQTLAGPQQYIDALHRRCVLLGVYRPPTGAVCDSIPLDGSRSALAGQIRPLHLRNAGHCVRQLSIAGAPYRGGEIFERYGPVAGWRCIDNERGGWYAVVTGNETLALVRRSGRKWLGGHAEWRST